MEHGVVLVTGGDQPLGEAVVKRLAASADTIVIGGSQDERLDEIETTVEATSVVTVRTDVRDEYDLERLAETASRAGAIDLVIPAARVDHSNGTRDVVETPYSAIDDELRTNLRGVFATVNEVDPHASPTTQVLVPLYSDANDEGSFAVSEGAIVGLVEALATAGMAAATVATGLVAPTSTDGIDQAVDRIVDAAGEPVEMYDGRTFSAAD